MRYICVVQPLGTSHNLFYILLVLDLQKHVLSKVLPRRLKAVITCTQNSVLHVTYHRMTRYFFIFNMLFYFVYACSIIYLLMSASQEYTTHTNIAMQKLSGSDTHNLSTLSSSLLVYLNNCIK